MRLASIAVAICLASCLAPAPACAQAQESAPFYRSKTIRIVISTGVAGGYAEYARVIAEHMGRHIAGNPSFIVQSMPGAGGMQAANYLFTQALQDGTTIGIVHSSAPLAPLWGSKGVRFDTLKFNWLGSLDRVDGMCISWNASPIKTWADMLSKEMTVGSSGAGSQMETYPAILNKLFGTKIKVIAGYKDGVAVYIAMERGELDGYCSFTWAAIKSARPNWLTDKQINVILQLSMAKHPELPDVPLVADLARDEASRQIFTLAFGAQKMGRPVATTPGVPPERLAALRQAFDAAMRDPSFQDDAKRNGLEAEGPITGADVDDMLRDIYATPRTIVQRYEAIRNER